MLSESKLSTPLRVLQHDVNQIFKDTYVLEFLGLPEEHPEGPLVQGSPSVFTISKRHAANTLGNPIQ